MLGFLIISMFLSSAQDKDVCFQHLDMFAPDRGVTTVAEKRNLTIEWLWTALSTCQSNHKPRAEAWNNNHKCYWSALYFEDWLNWVFLSWMDLGHILFGWIGGYNGNAKPERPLIFILKQKCNVTKTITTKDSPIWLFGFIEVSNCAFPVLFRGSFSASNFNLWQEHSILLLFLFYSKKKKSQRYLSIDLFLSGNKKYVSLKERLGQKSFWNRQIISERFITVYYCWGCRFYFFLLRFFLSVHLPASLI